MTDPSAKPTRAQQRRRTEEGILAAARQMFAELGYDRTTIRAVAATAGVDAGLVMHYFGTKDELFARAAELPADEPPSGTADELSSGTAEQVAEALLTSLAKRLDGEPVASLAVLRSMLTNNDAANRYRAAAEPQLSQITAAIPTADAELRASLLSAIVHGVIIERYLLRLGRLADASPDQIIDLLRPCFQTLATAQTPPPANRPATDSRARPDSHR
ncbi:TetR family transcriptional regulator [Plantactinospora sp. S1510]|uniref:TetR family transcriptional regulator n=1 Tax=Plantactinospora alkalitolerans TaxID=2789879 RepID=A0ABS0H5U5_9ACTN|nr:TetR/AcrR family transcriptional regulator [Plantactinospora alkalitolerans]MBF9133509.1 TetR family transcriptional regulator [Plantactinospora alkalitolerans]